MVFEADEVIAATGFVTPLRDLPDLGVATFGQSRLPAQTPFWESATVPGIFFAGTIGQGSKGLKKHGIPANSGAVHGARYNARCWPGTSPGRGSGSSPSGRRSRRRTSSTSSPRSSPAGRRSGTSGRTSRGLVSRRPGDRASATTGSARSRAFVDAAGADALAITLEADGTGDVYPVLYRRVDGQLVGAPAGRASAARLRHRGDPPRDRGRSSPASAPAFAEPGTAGLETALLAGVAAGLGVAVPFGAIAVLIVETSIRRGRWFGWAAGAGAATADLTYASAGGPVRDGARRRDRAGPGADPLAVGRRARGDRRARDPGSRPARPRGAR